MSGGARSTELPRGKPLQVLSLIVGGWLVLRVFTWQSPFEISRPPMPQAAPSYAASGGVTHASPAPVSMSSAWTSADASGPQGAAVLQPLPAPWSPAETASDLTAALSGRPATPAPRIVGEQLLLVAAFAHMELASQLASYLVATKVDDSALPVALGEPISSRRSGGSAATTGARWSGDGWLLLRQGANGPLAAVQPSYGRSQAGAVLRYRLAPSSGHRPIAYVRATRALAGPGESEVAAGFAARPRAGLPVSIAGEVRVSQTPAGREVRPAAFAVTELPPVLLPLGLRGEAYAQAGYVGGRFATAFFDGQARVDAAIVRLGRDSEVRAGGGVWGGAQKHAGRLDIGPGATMSVRLGQARARVALDYRVRVAGGAEPKSGPALTISAGF